MLYLIIGISAGIMIALLFVFANSAKRIDIVTKPELDAELTPAQAIRQLQEIKPYFAYKGKTWTALDMAIAAIMANEAIKGEEHRDNGENDIL